MSHIMRVELLKERMPHIEDLIVATLDSWADAKGPIYVQDETKTVLFLTAQFTIGLEGALIFVHCKICTCSDFEFF